MSYNDDEAYWFEQYRKGQFGAKQAVPTARRNPSRQQAMAKQAMKLYHSGQAPTLKQAWAMVKTAAPNPRKKAALKKTAAKKNPWHGRLYLPMQAETRPSLVESRYEYESGTERRSTLVPGPYGRMNPDVKFTKNGQPYVVEMVNGRKRARFLKKSAVSRKNTGYERDVAGSKSWNIEGGIGRGGEMYHGQAPGQFSTFGTEWAQGMQPVNRRNPKSKARKNGKAKKNR